MLDDRYIKCSRCGKVYRVGVDLGICPFCALGKIETSPFQPHSETSREAAQSIEPVMGTERARVLEFLRSIGAIGATDEEQQLGMDMSPNTQRPRRIELCNTHPPLVIDSGLTRRTISGRQAVVWVAMSALKN